VNLHQCFFRACYLAHFNIWQFCFFSNFPRCSCRCSSPFVRFGAGAAAPVQKPLLLLEFSVLVPLVSVLSLTRASTRTWLAYAFLQMVALHCNFLVHYFSKVRCQHIVSLPNFLLDSSNRCDTSFFDRSLLLVFSPLVVNLLLICTHAG